MQSVLRRLAGLGLGIAVGLVTATPTAFADQKLRLQAVPAPGRLTSSVPLRPVHPDVLYHRWGPGPARLQISHRFIAKLPRFAEPVEPASERYKDAPDERLLRGAKLATDVQFGEPALSLVSQSPAPALKFVPGVEGVDAGIAVGDQYIIVSQDHRIAFFDKQGNPLSGKGGFSTNMSATSFFSAFLAPKNADGSVNYANINRYLGFGPNAPIQCDATQSPPQFPCVNEFYDTRVLFDPVSKRFFVLSAARHQLWRGDNNSNPNGQYDNLARRYVAFAVSATEDPRDGFHQYMLTESNYRDWPRMAVDGNVFVIAHNASGDPGSYVATVLPVAALKSGDKTPPRFSYTSDDLGVGAVVPVTHFGNPGGYTLLLRPGKTVRIMAFPQPGGQWHKPAAINTSVTLGEAPSMLRPGAIYRNGKIYFTCVTKVEEGTLPRYSVRLVRIPVQVSGNTITASTAGAQGFLDWFFGRNALEDSPGDRVSYEIPSLAVNKNGDMLFGYGRRPFQTQNPLMPQARYTLWYGNEGKQRRSRLLQAGTYQPTKDGNPINFYGKGDFTTTVVDPADDKTFWTALFYGDPSRPGSYKTVVGKIVP
jgi:hypothetical protein